MLYHYLFIKLKSPLLKAAVAENFERSMAALEEKVPGMTGHFVKANHLDRTDGIDVVVRMDFVSLEAMQSYLASDLHTGAKKTGGDGPVSSIVFFDSLELI